MANQFLVEIHEYISTQMALGRQARTEAQSRGDRGHMKFCDGRMDELQTLRLFLSDQFDLDTQTYY